MTSTPSNGRARTAPDAVTHLLERVVTGEISPKTAAARLTMIPFKDTGGHARVDHQRSLRTGEPEVVYAAGKTPRQVADIVAELCAGGTSPIIATRAEPAHADALPDVSYDPVARLLVDRPIPVDPGSGTVAILCAGTSDLPVAREASGVLQAFGIEVSNHVDVGVAGVHRVLAEYDRFIAADVCIVVAGMEGALPSLVAGIVPCPVVAVPTSVGYGAALQGITPLLAMLTSCAPGISVVNIDNGFGAALVARRILRTRSVSS